MKTNVVWGPPASGKSTYVSKHKGENSITYDADTLMQSLSELEPHQKNTNIIRYILGFKEVFISKLKNEDKLDSAWIIQTWVDDETRDKLKELDPEYILMETTEAECIARVEANEDRPDSKEEQIQVIKDWFIKYNKSIKARKQKLSLRLRLTL